MENCEITSVKIKGAPMRFTQELIDLYPALVRHARIICKNGSLAEDLAHDTIEKALKYHDSFELGTNMKAWLYRIFMNSFVNIKRRDKLNHEIFENDMNDKYLFIGQGSIRSTEKESTSYNLMDSDIKKMLSKLPSVYSEIIGLVDLEDYKYEEVAQRLKIPMGTVMSRLHRRRKMLAKEIIN